MREIMAMVSRLLLVCREVLDAENGSVGGGLSNDSDLYKRFASAVEALSTFTIASDPKNRFPGDDELEREHDDDFLRLADAEHARNVQLADLRGLYKIALDQLEEATARLRRREPP